MMNKQTLERMQCMKLYGMHTAFKTSLEQKHPEDLTADQLVAQLVDAEYDDRSNRRVERLIKAARFRYKASVEQLSYADGRNLSKEQVERLADGGYVSRAENILITGSTGVGKSYLACALGYQACIEGNRCQYHNTTRLLSALKMAKAEGRYVRDIARLQR